MSRRFESWAGTGWPKGWGAGDGDVVWPIVDTATCGPIDGYPRPEQMLCWCPSHEKQQALCAVLNVVLSKDNVAAAMRFLGVRL